MVRWIVAGVKIAFLRNDFSKKEVAFFSVFIYIKFMRMKSRINSVILSAVLLVVGVVVIVPARRETGI